MRHSALMVLLALAASLPAGCARHAETVRGIMENADRREVDLQRRTRDPVHAEVVIEEAPYVDTRELRRRVLPPEFREQVTFREMVGQPLARLVRRMQELTGIVMEIETAESQARDGAAALSRERPGVPIGPLSDESGGLPVDQVLRQLGVSSGTGGERVIVVDHQGTVEALLDEVATQSGMFWEWDEERQRVVFFDTKLALLPVVITALEGSYETRVGGESGGGGGGGGLGSVGIRDISTASVRYQGRNVIDAKQQILDLVQGLLSPRGKVAFLPQLGILAVRDEPAHVERIRQWVEHHNRAQERQLRIEIDVYRVRLTEGRGGALTGTLAYRAARNMDTPAFFRLREQRPGVVVPIPDGTAEIGLPEQRPGQAHPFGGSQVLVSLLRELGHVEHERKVQFHTLPGRSVPYRIVRKIAYASSAGDTLTPGTGVVSSQIQQSTIEVGLSLMLTPRIHIDGQRINMHMMLSLSNLDRLTTFTSGNQRIQTPEVSSVEVVHETWLWNGEPLVMTGYLDRQATADERSGILSLGRAMSRERDLFVVAVTPLIQDTARNDRSSMWRVASAMPETSGDGR